VPSAQGVGGGGRHTECACYYRDTWYLALLRAAVFVGTAILFAAALAGSCGIVAAALAAPAGLLLAPRAADCRFRWPLLTALFSAIALLGLSAGSILGNLPGLAWVLGPGLTLRVIEVFTFGLLTLAVALALRTLALRVPACVVFEAATVVGVVAFAFHVHRQYPFSQPQWLADWAISRGYDPRHLLLAIGVATLLGIALLLLPRLRLLETVGTTLLLILFSGLLFLVIIQLPQAIVAANPILEREGRQDTLPSEPEPSPVTQPEPSPVTQPEPSPGTQPEPSPGTQPKPSPESEPHPSPQSATRGSSGDVFNWGMTKAPPLHPILLMTLHEDYVPVEDGGYYLRSHAFSRLEGNRLLPALEMDTDVVWAVPQRPVRLPVASPKDIFKDLSATVYLIGLRIAAPGPVNAFRLEPAKNPKPQEFTAAYQVTSRVLVHPRRAGKIVNVYGDLLSRSAGDAAWKPEVRQHYLALPADPRYRQLAEEIAGTLSPQQQRSPLCRALAVRRWMQENLTYDYNPRHRDAPDRVASFLFGDRSGYCVHLAHTMAFLLRAQGIPARVASGYCIPPERCGKRSALMACTTDDHAWAEIYLAGAGWVVVESATKGRIPPPDPTPDPRETDYYQSLVTKEPALPNAPKDHGLALWRLRLVLPFSLIVVLGAAYSIKVYRRLAVRFVPGRLLYRIGYRAVLDCLAEAGVRRGEGDTWDEFAATIAGWAPEFAELTAAHLRGAFAGGQRLDRQRWLVLLALVRRRIAATIPPSRRIPGLLNPLSWINVR
jgi:transglutaminase-like putative cysteine protease